ncbi:hypothetical protein N7474_001343 [Penicillium riverlandense]|uniref:uncharacterized protein n=1 Tax=Penicillium riverlandense TaxID=1903569 RepID=UPI0025473148|nr:uncharacterized protein N7474_001343 [Penicillium riverlandense]KAJ5833032.1 hypothetical protein N7474_001343 [Penicillium riverlandense]
MEPQTPNILTQVFDQVWLVPRGQISSNCRCLHMRFLLVFNAQAQWGLPMPTPDDIHRIGNYNPHQQHRAFPLFHREAEPTPLSSPRTSLIGAPSLLLTFLGPSRRVSKARGTSQRGRSPFVLLDPYSGRRAHGGPSLMTASSTPGPRLSTR